MRRDRNRYFDLQRMDHMHEVSLETDQDDNTLKVAVLDDKFLNQ